MTAMSQTYGANHQRTRRAWAPIVAAGDAVCCLCGYAIAPGARWDLDHEPGTTDIYRGPAHAGCNRSDGARRGNRSRVRRIMGKLCPCGQPFVTIYPAQRYCDNRCPARPRKYSRAVPRLI